MNISKETLQILQNLGEINPNCLVSKETTTINEQKSILAKAKFSEDLPEFGIYNMSEFLSSVGLFDNIPNFDFSEKYVVLSNDNSKLKYYFASKNLITQPPQKEIKLPSVDVEFELKEENINRLKKAASALFDKNRSNYILFYNKGTDLFAAVVNSTTGEGNSFEIKVGDYKGTSEFKVFFTIENFVFLASDYIVKISSGLISSFKSTKYDLEYWVAVEQDSNFN